MRVSKRPLAPGDRYVPWLRLCPSDWRFKAVKYLCSINADTLTDATDPDFEFHYVDIGSVTSEGVWNTPEPIKFADAPSRARRLVKEGDVVISTVRTYLRAIAFIDKQDDHLVCSTGFAVLTPSPKVIPRFLAYWARSQLFVDEIVARSEGVSYPATNASYIGNLPCPLLEKDHQRAIADFLDRETARIDELIAKKQRQIELLQEKRAAVISHAVTKGIPKADIKIEWVPGRLGRFIKLQRGLDITGAGERSHGYPVYSSGGISGRVETPACKGPGVIIGRKGTLGTVNYSESDYWPHDTTLWVKEFKGNCPKYVYYLLIKMKLERLDTGAANPTLNRNIVHPIEVTFPDSASQKLIADYLDHGTNKLDKLCKKIEESMLVLHEYRSALISAAVTGKIDVRGEAAA